MSEATFEVKAKSKTGKGIVDGNKQWFNTGKGISFSGIEKGDDVRVEYTESDGVRFVTAIKKVKAEVEAPIAPPPPPSLPPTTVAATPAPGGEAPVKAGQKRPNENGKSGDTEKMTKADWANKDRSIETLAVLKSVLESPAYAQLVVGKRKDEALAIGAEMFRFFLNEFYTAKTGG